MSYVASRLTAIEVEQGAPSPDMWVPPDVTFLSPHELLRLPVPKGLKAARAGVYFLFTGTRLSRHSELVYVGVSDNVKRRVAEHRRLGRFHFDSATYLAVPWPWHFAIEALYIRQYAPNRNRVFVQIPTVDTSCS